MATRNSTALGGSFSQEVIEAVWQKARVVVGTNPGLRRKDRCGAWIDRTAYGTTTPFGWEIDHEVPSSKGGSDHISNLEPLHWENNRHKGDDWPHWTCAVTATS